MNTQSLKILGGCFLLVFFILLLASPDSYTHDLFQRTDSANFFTSGKALFNGLVPYVDFTDSKGPLLWVIYGIGYLLSNHTYVGVFWLTAIMYTFTLFIIYKLAYLFLNNNKQSLFVVILMTTSFFSPWFHYEVRSEDWIQIFIVLAFYRICLFLFSEKGKEPKSLYITCFVLGISIIGTFFIKYNSTLMLGIPCLYTLYAIIREKKNIVLSFLSFLAGISVLAFPWLIYTLYIGNFDSFISEYITNTVLTTKSINTIGEYIHEWLFLTYDTHSFLLFTVSSVGALAMSRKVNKYKYFFIISFIGFYAIAIHRCQFLHWYYIASCLFFPVWLYIYICDVLYMNPHRYKVLKYFTIVSVSYTIFSNIFFWGYLTPTWFFRDNTARKEFYDASYYMSQIKNPTIIYYQCGTLGLETPVEGLPATRYWTTQVGATNSMLDSQIEAIKSKTADFIVAGDHYQYPLAQTDSFIKHNGYNSLIAFRTLETDFILYSKHQLKVPPKDFHVSNMEILFKRRIFK